MTNIYFYKILLCAINSLNLKTVVFQNRVSNIIIIYDIISIFKVQEIPCCISSALLKNNSLEPFVAGIHLGTLSSLSQIC